jgi:single-stranded-DNA-specific exonuclease
VVVAFDGGEGRGSARTINGFHLHAGLTACAVHLQAYGGHAGAAGMTVTTECFPAFQQAFWDAVRDHARGGPAVTETVADAAADLGQLDLTQAEELTRLAPFGHSNVEPLVALPGVQVQSTRVVGERHLQLTLSGNGTMADAIAFGMAAEAPPHGAVVDILAVPEVDVFRGYRRPRLRVKHIFRQES